LWSIWRAVLVLGLLVVMSADLHAAGTCGNGVLEPSEECDPGGTLRVNGDSTLATCTSGNDCFFELSCCKFNCQYVGQGATCADGNACTTHDHCDQVGQCIGTFVANGTSCNDGSSVTAPTTAKRASAPDTPGIRAPGTRTASRPVTKARPVHLDAVRSLHRRREFVHRRRLRRQRVCTHPLFRSAPFAGRRPGFAILREVCVGRRRSVSVGRLSLRTGRFAPTCARRAGVCQNGGCTTGTPVNCDDDNVCNGLETCDPLTGCVPGETLDCSDGNSCTSDLCAPLGGCSNPISRMGPDVTTASVARSSMRAAGGTCTGADVQMVALRSARFGTLAEGSGHIAVNDAKGIAKFARGGVMTDGSLVQANTVSLAPHASLDDVETNKRVGKGEVRGSEGPLTVPLGLSCQAQAAACGTTPVVVPETSVVRLSPGTYGDVKITRRGTLELDPGEYDFCSLKTFPVAAIRPRGDVIIRIAKDLKTNRVAVFEPYVGVTQIFVGGKKIKFGSESVISRMAISSPNGGFQLDRAATFDGAVCAQKIKGDRAVHFGCPLP
jgi:hypothetical protein